MGENGKDRRGRFVVTCPTGQFPKKSEDVILCGVSCAENEPDISHLINVEPITISVDADEIRKSVSRRTLERISEQLA